jgi:hypothetical protein
VCVLDKGHGRVDSCVCFYRLSVYRARSITFGSSTGRDGRRSLSIIDCRLTDGEGHLKNAEWQALTMMTECQYAAPGGALYHGPWTAGQRRTDD